MIHLLDNYSFSPALRYDAHRLIYTYSEKDEPIQIEGGSEEIHSRDPNALGKRMKSKAKK